MSGDLSKTAYRERLQEGDTIYFVEGEGPWGNGDLTVKKATMTSSEGKRYPVVILWPDLVNGPGADGLAKSPRELFTEDEVASVLQERDPSLLQVDAQSVDALLQDPICRQDTAAVLGQEVIARLADDEAAYPHDPER